MATISNGVDTITPDLVLGWAPGRPVRSVAHPVIGGVPDVTMRNADLRTGTLELFFADQAAATSAQNLLAVAGVWTLSAPPLKFVVAGSGDIALQAVGQDLDRWQVNAPYQEQP